MHKAVKFSLLLILALGVALPIWGADPQETTPPAGGTETPAEEDPGHFRYDGYLSARYVYRKAEIGTQDPALTATDQDLYSQLRLDATQPLAQRYEWHVLLTARQDLDGNQDLTGYYPYEGIGDTGSSSSKGYLYEAHFDINHLFRPMSQLRLGRQAGTRDEPIFFDGLAADLDLAREMILVVYGGRAVHFFELDGTETSDRLWGAGTDMRLFEPTTLSVDYLAARDLRESDDSRLDRQIAVKIEQHFGSQWRTLLRGRNINGEPRDVRLRVLGAIKAAALDISTTYFRQIRTQNELSNETSLYFDVLGQSHPFHSLDLKVRWQPGQDYAVDVGGFRRELLEEEDETPFNRQFTRTYATLEVDNLLVAGVFTILTGEQWDSATTDVSTWGLEAGYASKSGRRPSRYSIGSYYSLYQYDYYLELGERTRARTYFLDAQVPAGEQFKFTGRFEQEQADQSNRVDGVDTFQTARLGVRYDF